MQNCPALGMSCLHGYPGRLGKLFKLIAATHCIFYKPTGLELIPLQNVHTVRC